MDWVTGRPLSCNHCQETQIELIKKLFIDIDIDDIYILCWSAWRYVHTYTYRPTYILGRLMYVSHLVDFSTATLILT